MPAGPSTHPVVGKPALPSDTRSHPPDMSDNSSAPAGKPPDDLNLLRQIGAGDNAALHLFFLRWHDHLRSAAIGILHDSDAADDAATEAVLRIQYLAAEGSLPRREDDIRRWILRQARNFARNQLRKQPEVHGDWIANLPAPDASEADTEHDPEEDVQHAAMCLALRRLSKKTREAVLMYYLGELSYAEIAARQGGTASGAASRVERGILRLVAATHSREGRRRVPRSKTAFSPEERAHVLDTVAAVRARNPEIGLLRLAAEVCRKTGIYIHPDSSSASLFGHPHHRRT